LPGDGGGAKLTGVERPALPKLIGHGDVLLRLPVESDIDVVVDALQDREISRWTTVPWPYGQVEARTWAGLAARTRREGTALHLLIVDRLSGSLLGAVGAADLDWDGGVAEVGYWLAAVARGRGVATRALRVLTAFLLQAGMARCYAEVMAGNEASEGVLERVGYQREGVMRSVPAGRCGTDLERIDITTFSLLPTDAAAKELTGLDLAFGAAALDGA